MNNCLACHGLKLEGGIGPALAGGMGPSPLTNHLRR
ncbi:c-type cytochrome [Pseudomonas sp. B14(2022)]